MLDVSWEANFNWVQFEKTLMGACIRLNHSALRRNISRLRPTYLLDSRTSSFEPKKGPWKDWEDGRSALLTRPRKSSSCMKSNLTVHRKRRKNSRESQQVTLQNGRIVGIPGQRHQIWRVVTHLHQNGPVRLRHWQISQSLSCLGRWNSGNPISRIDLSKQPTGGWNQKSKPAIRKCSLSRKT